MSSLKDGFRELKTGGLLHRKIKCPRHYILKRGGIPFVMERKPSLKNISEANAKSLGINLWRRKKDPKTGQYIQNFADYHQPVISAAECRLRIYEATNYICSKCRLCVTA